MEEINPIEKKIWDAMKNDPAMQAEQSDLEDFFENIMHSKPVRYAESGKEAPVRILYYIYYSYLHSVTVPEHISEYKTSCNGAVIIPDADEAAGLLNKNDFDKFIKDLPHSFNSTKEMLSIVPYCRYSKNEEWVRGLISDMREWKHWYWYGAGGRKKIIIARGVLMLSETKASYDYAEKNKFLDVYARIRSTDEDSLRDARLASCGLDENGERVYDIGGNTVRISLQPALNFSILNVGKGKFVRTFPQNSDSPEKAKACAEDFKELQKGVKTLYKQRIKCLKEEYLTGKTRPAASWTGSYLKYALLRKLAELLVWECKEENKTTCFTVSGKTTILADGTEFTIPPESRIVLAHPVDMQETEVTDWQKYFLEHKLAQPFEQVWEPVMLQFLQYKVFGSHRVPDGWIVVTAGNPPEYNQSVHEFDVVTWDRLKRIDVEPNLQVWKEFAYKNGVHPAILTYLDIKPRNFYKVETTVNGKKFVTARGWDDLSRILRQYEKHNITVNQNVVGQYLQDEKIARDFAIYYDLYQKYKSDYQVREILAGTADPSLVKRARNAKFDKRYSLLGLLLDGLGQDAANVIIQEKILTLLQKPLKAMKTKNVVKELEKELQGITENEKKLKISNSLSQEQSEIMVRQRHMLEKYLKAVQISAGGQFETLKAAYAEDVAEYQKNCFLTKQHFQNAFSYCDEAFGKNGQELLILVTELTANSCCAEYIAHKGCAEYYAHSEELMFHERSLEIISELEKIDPKL